MSNGGIMTTSQQELLENSLGTMMNLLVHTSDLRVRSKTPSPPTRREFKNVARRSHSQGSSPQPVRFQIQFAKAQQAINEANGEKEKKSQSPFLARALRYSQGSNSPKLQSESRADGETRQKTKGFLKKNSLLSRLRSGSWHSSSSSNEIKESLDERKISEGACHKLPSTRMKIPNKTHTTYKENELSGLIHHVLESHLHNVDFDHRNATDLSCLLSKVLEKSVKSRLANNGKHFKISAIVYMGEVKDNGIKMATQCIWEPNQDHFAMATYESNTIFVSAMVFAVLYNGISTI